MAFLTPDATLSNPFPGGIERPTGSSLELATYLGKSVSFPDPHPKNPYSIRWALNVQRELRGKVLMEAGYVGNHAVHLGVDRQLNFVPASYLSALPVLRPGGDRLFVRAGPQSPRRAGARRHRSAAASSGVNNCCCHFRTSRAEGFSQTTSTRAVRTPTRFKYGRRSAIRAVCRFRETTSGRN